MKKTPTTKAAAGNNEREIKPIDAELVELLKAYKERHGLSNDALGKQMGSNGTYVLRALNGTFTGDADAFTEAARKLLDNEFQERTKNGHLVETGFMVEPMFGLLDNVKHCRSIGVAWSDPGKGKTEALEVYRRKDPLCIVVTAKKSMSGWRALRNAVLKAVPTKRLMKGESWDEWITRTFKGTGRLLIVDNAHLLTAGARHWLAYDWNDETKCPVALVGNEEIVPQWKRNAQHYSRVGVAYEVAPAQKPSDTARAMLKLHLPSGEKDEAACALAVRILKSDGACRAVEKHLLIAADLMKTGKYAPAQAIVAANRLLLTSVNLAA